jgi:hypothetical protein
VIAFFIVVLWFRQHNTISTTAFQTLLLGSHSVRKGPELNMAPIKQEEYWSYRLLMKMNGEQKPEMHNVPKPWLTLVSE